MLVYRAEPRDETLLKALAGREASDGSIRIQLLRNPDYFRAFAVEGVSTDIIAVKSDEDPNVIAVASRSEKPCFLNGQNHPQVVGYLGNLRIAAGHRCGPILGRGYSFLRELHRNGSARFYLSTIVEDNSIARMTLSSGRAGLPVYQDIGAYITTVLRVNRRMIKRCSKIIPGGTDGADFAIRNATKHDLSAIIEFLNRQGRTRQFFPVYSENDMCATDGLLRGLAVEEIVLAVRGKAIIGTAAIWNQTSFRQWRVKSYQTPMRWVRPIYNSLSALTSRPALPCAGSIFPYRMLALPCVAGDREDIFGSLLKAVFSELVHSGQSLLVAGFHERDPLKRTLDKLPHLDFRSRLYLVYWPDGQAAVRSLNGMIPYVEVGGL